ncbi:hypothetical protein NQ318_001245 [Aromia moschata]|uniref:Uncharacterized protein n=1 Tax=Aromia moschata TaxID=1265417 RepID=A0AAV8ZFZ1_9CUCU|nr:hypothetical protein NQ318_001245 [Aromia moschata]
MEYPLQDFDCDQETEFLLGHSSSHGNEMDVHTARTNRNPKRRRSVGSILCSYIVRSCNVVLMIKSLSSC